MNSMVHHFVETITFQCAGAHWRTRWGGGGGGQPADEKFQVPTFGQCFFFISYSGSIFLFSRSVSSIRLTASMYEHITNIVIHRKELFSFIGRLKIKCSMNIRARSHSKRLLPSRTPICMETRG